MLICWNKNLESANESKLIKTKQPNIVLYKPVFS